MNLAAHFIYTEMPLGNWLRDTFPRLQREPAPSPGGRAIFRQAKVILRQAPRSRTRSWSRVCWHEKRKAPSAASCEDKKEA